jgi:hypothetical protein
VRRREARRGAAAAALRLIMERRQHGRKFTRPEKWMEMQRRRLGLRPWRFWGRRSWGLNPRKGRVVSKIVRKTVLHSGPNCRGTRSPAHGPPSHQKQNHTSPIQVSFALSSLQLLASIPHLVLVSRRLLC